MLTDNEISRYSRHLLLDDVGVSGQQKLKRATVLIIGLGGLGSSACLYLAAAGVGSMVIADFDHVDTSNLQRQIAYSMSDLKTQKTNAMKARLRAINPEIKVRCIDTKMNAEQLSMELILADLVLDCTDNIKTRQMINQACVKAKTPLIIGAAIRFEGQLIFFDHSESDSACYHCLMPSNDEQALNCSNSGIVGPVVGTIGTLQALEAIKYIVGLASGVNNKLKLFDGKSLDWQTFNITKNPECSVCSDNKNKV